MEYLAKALVDGSSVKNICLQLLMYFVFPTAARAIFHNLSLNS